MRISGVTPVEHGGREERAVGLAAASPPRRRGTTASSTSPATRSTALALTSGPISVSGSRGSPTFSARAFSPRLVASSSDTERSATIFSVDMQICPWCMNAPNFAAATASSRSASASTTIGALPPSSSSTRLRWRAAFSATSRPTRVEPVKLIRRTAGWAISSSTTSDASSGSWVMRLTTPGGRPASSSARAISACVRGQTWDAFSTTVLPKASGAATARVPRMTGAFQGAIPTTTPAGWRTPIASRPGTSEGITSPLTAVVSAAASPSIPAARWQLNIPQPNVPPVSRVTVAAMSVGPLA